MVQSPLKRPKLAHGGGSPNPRLTLHLASGCVQRTHRPQPPPQATLTIIHFHSTTKRWLEIYKQRLLLFPDKDVATE
ncbi:hypothetical protein V6N13_020499 [Hibiscus sabdariffa]|uniref:Uncharacterized protein n=1 Tax=Hibiscus sabdariffa TaxID=183260 RepID=A0ABR2EU34_9ROSI